MINRQAPSINKDGMVRQVTKKIREDDQLKHLQEIRLVDVSRIMTHLISVIEESLLKGLNVKFVGFGTFQLYKRPSRFANKPGTKEKILVKESWVAKFTCGKPLTKKLTDHFSQS